MKNIIFSKTAWTNLVTLIAPAIAYLATSSDIIKPFVDPKTFAFYALCVGLFNVLIRRFTKDEVTFFGGSNA